MKRRKKKVTKVITFDCETDPFKFEEYVEPFLWCAFDGVIDYVFYTTETFVEWLANQKAICYAHNGGKFDTLFLRKFFNRDESMCIANGRVLSVNIGFAEIRDSYSILPVPLRSLGDKNKKKDIDISKLHRDVRHLHMPEIIDYCKMDCRVLYESVTAFRKEYGDKLTIASAAFSKLLKLCGMKKPQTNHSIDFPVREYYYGGRVEVFKQGFTSGDINVYDINSAYPFAMIHHHPDGDYIIESDKAPRVQTHNFYSVKARSWGYFPFREKGKSLSFPDDGIVRTFKITGWELLEYLKAGFRVEEHLEQIVFSKTITFTPYIEHFHNQKIKAVKDSFDYITAKLFLNSSYGKFGMNPINYKQWELVDGDSVDDDWNLEEYFDDNDSMLVSKPLDKQVFNYVWIAASITGFVRAYLINSIKGQEKGKVLYCDTDSMMISGKATGLELHAKQLGAWDLELSKKNIVICGKKVYAMYDDENDDKEKHKVRSKGARLTLNEIIRVAKGEEVLFQKDSPVFSLKKGQWFLERTIKMT